MAVNSKQLTQQPENTHLITSRLVCLVVYMVTFAEYTPPGCIPDQL